MKDKVLVRRKHTPMKVRQQRKIVEVPTCVTRYSAGVDVTYDFDINQTDFEVDPDHLPLILLHCDMEVVSSLKDKEFVSEGGDVAKIASVDSSSVAIVDSMTTTDTSPKKKGKAAAAGASKKKE